MSCKIQGTLAAMSIMRSGINIEGGFFVTPGFIEDFGDWVNEDIENISGEMPRVNSDNSPAIYSNKAKTQLFYYNKDNLKRPINAVKFHTLPIEDRDIVAQSIVDTMLYELFNTNMLITREDGSRGLNPAKDIQAKETLGEFYDNMVEALLLENIGPGVKESLLASKDDYIIEIKNRLKSIGITYRETLEEEEEEDINGANPIKQRASYQRKTQEKANTAIKLILETLPMYDYDGDIVTSAVLEDRPMLMDPSKAWAVMLNAFSDIPSQIESDTANGIIDINTYKAKDMVDLYLTKLDTLSIEYPWAETVYSIIASGDLDLQVSFFRAFNNQKNKIFTTVHSAGGLKTMNTEDSGGDARFIMKDWSLRVANKLYPGNQLDEDVYDMLFDQVEDARESADDMTTIKLNPDEIDNKLNQLADIISPVFKFLDIAVTPQDIRTAYYNRLQELTVDPTAPLQPDDVNFKKFVDLTIVGLERLVNNPSSTFDSSKSIISNNYKFLAEAKAFTQANIADHMASVGKNRVYLYSLPTVLAEQINELKANPSYVKALLEHPKFRNSKMLEAMANPNKLKAVKLGLRGVLQREGESAKGLDNKNIGPSDYAKVDMYNVLRVVDRNGTKVHDPLYNTQVPADKNREYLLSVQMFEETDTIEQAVDIFYKYVLDEYQEMIMAKNDILSTIEAVKAKHPNKTLEEVLDIASNSFVIGYTLDKEGKLGEVIVNEKGEEEIVFTGDAFKFKLFESLNDLISKKGLSLMNAQGLPSASSVETGDQAFEDVTISGPVKELIKNSVEFVINRVRKDFEDKGNEIYTEPGKIIPLKDSISSDITDYYRDKYKAFTHLADPMAAGVDAIFRDYVVNSMMSKIEYAKLFTGGLQYYKHGTDYIKRVPSTYIDGLQIMTGIREGDIHFRQMTFKTEGIIDSELLESDALSDSVKQYYKFVDRTDAQAWITPKRWKDILVGTGKFGPEAQAVYDKLEAQWAFVEMDMAIPAELELTTSEIKTLSAQPMKGVYFKNEYVRGPVFLKYSQAVLIPSLINNAPKAKALAKLMADNNIDEAVADTGVKVGSNKPIILDEAIAEGSNVDITANIRTLDNRNWRLQQDLPTKTAHPNKIGTQIQKIIVSALRFMGDVEVSGDLTGTELADAIDESLKDLSNAGTEAFMKKYGINEDYKIKDLETFYSSVLRDMESDGEVIHALVNALKAEVIPAALPSLSGKITASFLASNKRAATNLMTTGGSFIQISDHLVSKVDINKGGIKMLKQVDRLKPPRVVMGKNGKPVVLPGQVFIPHKMIAKYIPNYKELSMEELSSLLPAEVKEMIGYRIPTQSRASTDILEVVGILPPEMGDSVIAYGEITAKTGSDFDIDKMFFMLPELALNLPESTFKNARAFLSYLNLSDNKMRTILSEEYELPEEELLFEVPKSGRMVDLRGKALQNLFIETVIFSEVDNEYKKHFDQFRIDNKLGLKLATKGIKGKQNRVFKNFAKALKSPLLYEAMMTSIDNDTTETSMMAFLPKDANYDLKVFDPLSAMTVRFNYKAGAAGIGEMVNANNDHTRSQGKNLLYNVGIGRWGNIYMDEQYSQELSHEDMFGRDTAEGHIPGLLDYINEFRVSKGSEPLQPKDIQRRPINDVLSELTNAFVDIANKDAFITKSNWGSLMNNYGTMLLRTGMHPSKVFALINQPAVRDMVKQITDGQGIINNISASKVRESVTKKYRALADSFDETVIPPNKIDELDFLSLLKTSKSGEVLNKQEALNQLVVLEHIINTLEVTKKYGNTLTTSKTGENGAGKTIGAVRTLQNKLAHSLSYQENKLGFPNLRDKYFDSEGNGTLLMSFYENTVGFIDRVIDSNPMLFYGNSRYNAEVVNQIIKDNTRNPFLSSALIADNVYDAVQTYLLSGFDALNKEYTQEEKDALTKKLFQLKTEGNYAILEKLYLDETPTGDILVMNKVSTLPTRTKNTLTNSWQNLLNKEPEAGKYLLHHIYNRAGFRPGPRNYSELIPPLWLVEQGLEKYVKNEPSSLDAKTFTDQLFRNEIGRELFTQTVGGTRIKEKGIMVVPSVEGTSVNTLIRTNINSIPKYAMTSSSGYEDGGLPVKLVGFAYVKTPLADGTFKKEYQAVYMDISILPKNEVYYNTDEIAFSKKVDPENKESVLEENWQAIVRGELFKAQGVTGSLTDLKNMENKYRENDLRIRDLALEQQEAVNTRSKNEITLDEESQNDNCS